MIFVDRTKFSQKAGPALLDVQKRAAEVREREIRRQGHGQVMRYELTMFKQFKPLLKEMFHGKCAYCESSITPIADGVIEHFRPKNRYPYLAFEWNNLLYACQICNRYKSHQFPTHGAPTKTPPDDIAIEKPLLLDPCSDRPEEHLAFSASERLKEVKVTGLTERGGQLSRSWG